MADDYYAILGVEKDATAQDIKRSFRQIARECHPDRSGGNEEAEARFKKARKAYETLMDPVTRARYDRRGQRRLKPGESFFDAFYRHTGDSDEGFFAGSGAAAPSRPPPSSPPSSDGPQAQTRRASREASARSAAGGPTGRRNKAHDPGNDVSLDDLFNGFGFGGPRPKTARSTPRDNTQGRARRGPQPNQPTPGEDVHVDLEVPASVARDGGSITAVYHRMQRADSWRPGMGDPGLVRIQDIADVRIIPGTRAGEVLREKGLGNADAHGGPYGDLVVRVKIVGRAQSAAGRGPVAPQPRHMDAPPPLEPGPDLFGGGDRGAPGASEATTVQPDGTHVRTLDITVVEALLGGRVPLQTEHGPVRLTIAPGTSGGTKLRLRGKGPVGSDGSPTDLYVVTRVVVPRSLDEESRRLIEQFARLNPE